MLEKVLARLDETKVEREGAYTWHTAPALLPAWQRELNPKGYYNLGLAHGVPGVLVLLARAWAAGIQPHLSGPLLAGGMSWLLAQQQQRKLAIR